MSYLKKNQYYLKPRTFSKLTYIFFSFECRSDSCFPKQALLTRAFNQRDFEREGLGRGGGGQNRTNTNNLNVATG